MGFYVKYRGKHMRVTLAAVIVMIMVAVAVPAVAMIGCSMEMSAPIAMAETLCGHIQSMGEFISQACGGTYVVIDGLADSVQADGGFSASLIAALAAFAMLFFMPVVRESAPVLVRVAPPPPPEDPLGQRLSI